MYKYEYMYFLFQLITTTTQWGNLKIGCRLGWFNKLGPSLKLTKSSQFLFIELKNDQKMN